MKAIKCDICNKVVSEGADGPTDILIFINETERRENPVEDICEACSEALWAVEHKAGWAHHDIVDAGVKALLTKGKRKAAR